MYVTNTVLYLYWKKRKTRNAHYAYCQNGISGVMVSVLASSAVDRGFEPRSSQTKEYRIGMCFFIAKHAALKSESKD